MTYIFISVNVNAKLIKHFKVMIFAVETPFFLIKVLLFDLERSCGRNK